MAALGTIRKRGALLIGIIGLGLFGFIAGDVFRSCETQTNEARMQVGEVAGERISVQDFQSLVEEMMEVYKMQGNENLTEAQTNQLRDQVWSQYVTNTLVNKEAEKLGLTVTDEELQDVIKEGTNQVLLSASMFVNPQTRRFEASALQDFLNAYKTMNWADQPQLADQYMMIYKYWQFIEKQLRQNILNTKYNVLLANSLLSNPIAAKAGFDAKNIDNDILLASIPYSTVKDEDAKVEEADLKAKYEEQKDIFKSDSELRNIKYVSYKVTASAADREALMATMNDAAKQLKEGANASDVVRKAKSVYAYNGLPMPKSVYTTDIATAIDTMKIGEVSAPFETVGDNTYNVIKLVAKAQLPDSVQIRMIQVGGATIEAAQKTADSIVVALKGGAVFDSLAVQFGQSGAKQWVAASQFATTQAMNADDKKWINAIFTSPVKTLKAETLSNSCVVMEVLDRRAISEKYDLAVVKTPIAFSNETYSDAYNKFSRYVSENQNVEDLENNAAKYGFTVFDQEDMENTAHYVAGVSGTSDIVKWIFSEAEVGDVSQLYECGENDNLMVVALTGVTPKGYYTLSNPRVRSYLNEEVLRDKKFDVVKTQFDDVKDIASAAAKGIKVDTISRVTAAVPTYLSSLGTAETLLSAAVASTEEGKFSSSVVKGTAGAYMFQVLKKTPRANQTYDEQAEEDMQKQIVLQNVMRSLIPQLYSEADVVDNRYLFF